MRGEGSCVREGKVAGASLEERQVLRGCLREEPCFLLAQHFTVYTAPLSTLGGGGGGRGQELGFPRG